MGIESGVGSGNSMLLNQGEFGDWLYAQSGSLVLITDVNWTSAGDNGPFGNAGEPFDVACVTVRTDRMYLSYNASDIGVECAIGGPYWFVGYDWANWVDAVGTSEGYVTYYKVS